MTVAENTRVDQLGEQSDKLLTVEPTTIEAKPVNIDEASLEELTYLLSFHSRLSSSKRQTPGLTNRECLIHELLLYNGKMTLMQMAIELGLRESTLCQNIKKLIT